jgi:hypothetical protein
MSKGLSALVQILGAAGTGYMQGQRIVEDRDRRVKQDARDEEEYQYKKEGRDQARALDKDVSGALTDQSVQDATPTNVPLPMEVPTYKLGDQTFGDKGAADVAALGVNSRASKYQRAADAAPASTACWAPRKRQSPSRSWPRMRSARAPTRC